MENSSTSTLAAMLRAGPGSARQSEQRREDAELFSFVGYWGLAGFLLCRGRTYAQVDVGDDGFVRAAGIAGLRAAHLSWRRLHLGPPGYGHGMGMIIMGAGDTGGDRAAGYCGSPAMGLGRQGILLSRRLYWRPGSWF